MTFEEWLEFYSPGTAFTEGEKAPLHAAWLAGAAQRPEEKPNGWVIAVEPHNAEYISFDGKRWRYLPQHSRSSTKEK